MHVGGRFDAGMGFLGAKIRSGFLFPVLGGLFGVTCLGEGGR